MIDEIKKHKNNIITGVLLIAAGIAIATHFKQDSELRRLQSERFQEQINDAQQQLEQTESELRRSNSSRDSLLRLSNTWADRMDSLRQSLKRKDREIASIRGRYNHVSVDSLSHLMESRASRGRAD